MRETKMTQADALNEAQKRWGPKGWAEISPGPRTGNGGRVGYLVGLNAMDVKGFGESWEDAFTKADSVSPSGATHE